MAKQNRFCCSPAESAASPWEPQPVQNLSTGPRCGGDPESWSGNKDLIMFRSYPTPAQIISSPRSCAGSGKFGWWASSNGDGTLSSGTAPALQKWSERGTRPAGSIPTGLHGDSPGQEGRGNGQGRQCLGGREENRCTYRSREVVYRNNQSSL